MVIINISEQREFRRALRIILDVATSLQMSTGAICYLEQVASRFLCTVLHQCWSSWCYSLVRRRDWNVQNSSKLEHSRPTQPQNSRAPRLMYEEFSHLLPRLCQPAFAPNCYEFGFLQPLSEDWVCRLVCNQA